MKTKKELYEEYKKTFDVLIINDGNITYLTNLISNIYS